MVRLDKLIDHHDRALLGQFLFAGDPKRPIIGRLRDPKKTKLVVFCRVLIKIGRFLIKIDLIIRAWVVSEISDRNYLRIGGI